MGGGAMSLTFLLDDGTRVQSGAVLARAGEGTIYEVAGRSDWVLKIFHGDLKDLAAKRAKVAAMTAARPEGAEQADGFVVLTWPLHVVEGDDGAIGYVMPRVDTANAVEIHTLSNPADRANPLPSAPQWTPHVTWHHLVNVAANLCLAVETVHRVDAVIGDFQERNILVNDTTRVTLVDCDSMQFTNPAGHQFLCAVGRPEYTAPELAGTDLSTQARAQSSDLFALAVFVHQLLMAGNHPFLRGNWTGGGEQPDALTLARSGQWAGGPGSKLLTYELAPPVSFLPANIQRLFVRAFTDGARDPSARPSAAEWRAALQGMQIGTCPRGHQIPVEADPCPWCVIEAQRANRRQRQQQQQSMRVTAPTQAAYSAPRAAYAAPQAGGYAVGQQFVSPPTGSGAGRNRALLIGGGVIAVVVAVMLYLALGDSDTGSSGAAASSRSTSGGSTYSGSGDCSTMPTVTRAALGLTPDGLSVKATMNPQCAAGQSLSGQSVLVTVSDGARDVASGVFDLSSTPLLVSAGGSAPQFVFPAGMYWRTPDLITGNSLSVDISGATASTAGGSGSSSVVAARPAAPAHGDADSTAAAVLQELSTADLAAARDTLNDHWVPQTSSKKIGLVTDGITYGNADILRDHLGWRQRFPGVRLLYSGNWSTFNGSSWWVTVIGSPSSDAATANAWCDAHNIDRWNCFAKLLSTTAGVEGTTVLRN